MSARWMGKNPIGVFRAVRTAVILIYYLYPEFMNSLVRAAKEKMNLYKLDSLYFEQNFIKTVLKITSEKQRYSIYGLDMHGKISHFYLTQVDANETSHLLTELGRQNVLSGNSALLIWLISSRIGTQTTVGYRTRKNHIRPNREFAVAGLIEGRATVQEPKNTAFNAYYSGLPDSFSMEEKANAVNPSINM